MDRKMEQLGQNMPGGFFIYRADTTEEIVYANDIVFDIFGCKNAEEFRDLTCNTFRGMVYPEDYSTIEASISGQIVGNNRNLDFVEYRIMRTDGSVRWVDDYGRFVHSEEYGDCYYVLIRDITEIYEQREENSRRAEVIEGLSREYTSIYLMDLDKGSMRPYRLKKQYFRDIVGGEEEALIDNVFPIYAREHVLSEDRERFLAQVNTPAIRERLQNEDSYSIMYRCMNSDNSIRYMDAIIVHVLNENGKSHAVMGVRDVTEQTMSLQHDLAEKLNMEMELNREKHINEIKSAFLFNISHDIRTPMTAIKGFTELAVNHIDEPGLLKTYLANVSESNELLLGLIDDLLDMSRLDYGRVVLRQDPCDLKKAILETVEMYENTVKEKSLNIETDLDIPDYCVLVDEHRFKRIISNLLSNAVKFTNNGGNISITAKQKHVSDSGYARYEFTVSDDGIGMSDDFIRKMFEAFEREESSTVSGNTGTGLGLAITKKLIDVIGGTIDVHSEKGKGTKFTIGLPLKLADESLAVKHENDSLLCNSVTAPDNNGRSYRILLVEDIEINRMLAEHVLNDAGFMIDSVPDGSDAVETIKKSPAWYYDLILMDIQMPVMNGYEATRKIRAMSREDTKLIPIVALSANAGEDDKRLSMDCGMNAHIAKPFDVAHLIGTISGYLRKKNQTEN